MGCGYALNVTEYHSLNQGDEKHFPLRSKMREIVLFDQCGSPPTCLWMLCITLALPDYIHNAQRYPIIPTRFHLDHPTPRFFCRLHTCSESISLNLHSRVKIEDESHGYRAKFSEVWVGVGGEEVLHLPDYRCAFVLFASLYPSLQDRLVKADWAVSLKQVMS